MILFFLFLSLIGFVLNLDTPRGVSYASPFALSIEYCSVLFLAWIIIKRILKDSKIIIQLHFYKYFLLSFTLGLFILYFVWTPMLDPNAEEGYDPMKYYAFALQILKGDVILWGLNYWGVVYFFVGCMSILGIDPLVPLFVNSLLSLTAILLLARLLSNEQTISYYAFLFVIPEVIYYQMVSSREILCMAPAVIFVVKSIELRNKVSLVNIAFCILSFLLIAVIRPPMTVPLVLFVVLTVLTKAKGKNFYLGIFMVLMLVGAVLYGLHISSSLGSNFDTEYLEDTVSSGTSGEAEIANGNSGGGLTTLLLPHNPFEYVVFGIIRSFAYVIPPPAMITDFSEQFSPTYVLIYENLTTLLMFFFLPTLFMVFFRYKSFDEKHKAVAIVLLLYFFMIGVSLPTLIQHRYRFIYEIFYFALAIYLRSNRLVKKRIGK